MGVTIIRQDQGRLPTGWGEETVAAILNTDTRDVHDANSCQPDTRRVSSYRLITWLVRLGYDVEVVVH